MSAYLVLGPAGSGKSTLGESLRARGYQAIDLDHLPGLIRWRDVTSGHLVRQLPTRPFASEWIMAHRREWDPKVLADHLGSNSTKPCFYCGGAENARDVVALFTKCYGLHVPDDILITRLHSRAPKKWAIGSDELTRLLEWNAQFPKFCAQLGITLIDATDKPQTVVKKIINDLSINITRRSLT